ncbi:MAG: FHA domain-containing protein [Acidimicrobiales bacterium]
MAVVAVCALGSSEPGPERGWLLSLGDGAVWPIRRSIVIGRSPLRDVDPADACDLLLVDDPTVSRAHLRLQLDVDGAIRPVTLTGTTNVVRGGDPIDLGDDGALHTGDELTVGGMTFRLLAAGPIVPSTVAVYPQTHALERT